MKKIFVILAAVVLSAAIFFAGCSARNNNSGNGGNTDPGSGSTTSQGTDNQDDTAQTISREEAVQIVLDRVEGADESDIRELKTDNDDGRFVYEGELLYGGYEYDFEIDGTSGEIIQWEIDEE